MVLDEKQILNSLNILFAYILILKLMSCSKLFSGIDENTMSAF